MTIALTREEKSTNKAPPPPAPKTKAPPENIKRENQQESPPKSASARSIQIYDRSCSSGEEEEERGNIVAWPIDLTKPEQVPGQRSRMKLSISELKDELERNRYLEKRRSQTFKIICDPDKLGRILQGMANEPTQSTLFDLELPEETPICNIARHKPHAGRRRL